MYQVTVITGDRFGAGTDSSIYVTIYGNSDSSKEALLDNEQNNFERGQTDIFGVESVYLGEITKIRIRSKGDGIGADWFLDKVIIHSEKDNKKWYFLCGQWIDEKNGLTRELPASTEDGVSCLPLVQYKIEVYTGDRRGAGTDANVFIQVCFMCFFLREIISRFFLPFLSAWSKMIKLSTEKIMLAYSLEV